MGSVITGIGVAVGMGDAVGELSGGLQQTILDGVDDVLEASPSPLPTIEESAVEPIPPSVVPPIVVPVLVRTVDVVGPSKIITSPPGHKVVASAGDVAVVLSSCLYPSGHDGATIGV